MISKLARDRSGNVAMMWGLMGAVLVGLMGVTVDFTRAQAIRNQMQNAADGAALVAERSSNLTMAQRTIAARAFFDAEMGVNLDPTVTFTVTQLVTGGHQVTATMPMDMSIARVVNDEPWDIVVNAVAEANASPPIEVALVLDNTGSMSADMESLRTASDLAADLLSLDGDTVKVALVPFVAQVNIGNQASHMAWMDQAGTAPMNGELLEDRMIAFRATSNGNSNGNCNWPTTPTGYPGPYQLSWIRSGSRCHAITPADGINYFMLFDRLTNADWKGCVEARPEPYDITDVPPSIGTPATMFVPFFWLDTGGTAGQASSSSSSAANYLSSNSYLADTAGDIASATMSSSNGSSTTAQDQREARFFNVFKYRNTAASIDDVAPDTRGPNRGCPTPIVPLTASESIIQTNITAMRHWNGGGTNQAEGLAWGWRVLSPAAPFSEGEPFNADRDNVRKVIVLMSDGENTNVGSDAVVGSDYSAYNHMGYWRDIAAGDPLTQLLFGLLHGVLPPQYRRNITSSNQYVTYVNARETQLCTNIKNAGIEIYTVIFRETDTATVNLMRNCASSTQHFYRADNATQLSQAFHAIGSGIGQLRLTH